MRLKKTEKEIIKAIVKYSREAKSLAEVLHLSKLLEKRGIAIIHQNNMNYVFLDKGKYDDWFSNEALGYIAEIISLISKLIEKRHVVIIPFESSDTKTIGIDGMQGVKPNLYRTNGFETICLEAGYINWLDVQGNQKCWPYHYTEQKMQLSHFFDHPFIISQELKDLVKHNFKTEEERRFSKQQWATWISILIAFFTGLFGILFK